MGGYAWVTLATNDAYSLGALVLAHSLRRVGTKYELAVLVTPGVTDMMREKLASVFSLVQEVNVLDSKDEANLALLARPELGITFTKLHCWRLTQYDKCVFVDADTLVVRNCDELFEREELSAAPDVGWPDCFNSGVFVFKPSQQTFASITAFAAAKGSFDGGDQGLLNMYFNDWAQKDISKHLPFIYNMCSTATYSYLPAFKQFGEDVRIIHFIGITKPWLQYFDTLTSIVQPPAGSIHLQPLLQLWWNIFCEKVHPQLSPVMATSTLAPIWHEFIPLPVMSSILNIPAYYDTNHETYNDVCSQTLDFSEFKDPWENYGFVDNTCTNNDRQNTQFNDDYNTISTESQVGQECCVHEALFNETFQKLPSKDYTSYYTKLDECLIHTHYQELKEDLENTTFNKHDEQQKQLHLYSEDNHQHHSVKPPEYHYWPDEYSMQQNQYQHTLCQHNKEHYCDSEHQRSPNQNLQPCHEEQYNQHISEFSKHISNNKCHALSEIGEQERHHVEHSCNTSQYNQQDNYYKKHDTGHHVEHNYHYKQQDEIIYHEYENHNKENCNQYNVQTCVDNISCNQIDTSSITHHDNRVLEEVSSEQNAFSNIDKKTDIQILTSHPSSTPCTNLHNVTTQPDLNKIGHLDSSNAGLAGALAQMTLGEPRSVEQIALEEHMRKQSWEQGQIDYMGRDSFDNIWKKICETLSLVPQRQPSPPKTDYNDELNLEETTNELIALPEEIKKVDTLKAKTITDQTSEQSLLCEISRDNILEQKDMEEDSIATPIQSIFPSDSSMKHSVITPFSASKETSKFHGDFKDSLDKCFSAKTSESEQFCKEDDTLLLAKLSGQTSTEIISEQPHLSKFDVQNLPQDNTILSSSSEIPEIYEHISSCTSNRDSNTFSVSSVSSDNIPKSCIDSIKQSTSDKNLLFSKSAEQEKKVDTSVSISNQNICTVIDTNLKTSNENVDYSVEEKLNKETKKCESIDSPNVENIFSTSVPIQVAESVLKTEPKEESKLMKEVVSEVVPPVQENVVPLSETLVELADQTRSYNLSSNVSPDEVNNIVGKSVSLHESNSSVKQNVEVLETLKTKPEIEITKENIQQLDTSKDLLEPIKIEQQSSEINSSIPKDDSILETTVTKQDATVTDPVYKEEEVTKLVDIQQQLQKEEMKILEENKEDSRKLQEKSAILLSKSEDQILQKLNETAVNPTISTPDTVRSSEISSIECPIRPNRTKETDLSTPTAITEPVPSVSPTVTVPESENQGKTVKKSTKKTVKKTPSEYDSTDGADGDSTEKKSVKKVVKKTVKKSKDTQDEGTESCTSTEKPKKTVKVAKKMSKPSQISGTDPPVPETPQVGSSNAPVPPKRKIKTSSTKSAISKRTDAEP